MTEIDTTEKIYAEKFIIIFDNRVISDFVIGTEFSLDTIFQIAQNCGFEDGLITVIFETMQSGVIYQYGNYGKFWVKHGITNGLA